MSEMNKSNQLKNNGIGSQVGGCLDTFISQNQGFNDVQDLHLFVMGEVERTLLMKVLDAVEGNQTKASKILGLNRNTLRKKILFYQL